MGNPNLTELFRAEKVARRMGDEALSRRVTALEEAVKGVDQIDGHNLRRAELAERRLEEARRRIGALQTQVESQLRNMETMTDYATKLRTERDMARNSVEVLEAQRDALSESLTRAKDMYTDAAVERDMRDAAIADVVNAVKYLEELGKITLPSGAFARGYKRGIERCVREIKKIV